MPRPPMHSAGYTTRHSGKTLWTRKWNLQQLVASHVKGRLPQTATSEERLAVVEKAGHDFAPFAKLVSRLCG